LHWIEQIIAYADSIMTAAEHKAAVEQHAKTIGTFDADDRSSQYPLHDQKLVHKAINDCWEKIHQLESENRRKNKEIAELREDNKKLTQSVRRYRVVNIALTSMITALAWKGLEALITYFR
jgi:hypothetical protein